MVEDFTQMTSNTIEQREWVLAVADRCDVCGAQALVQTIGTTGDLLFCAHHYEDILNNEKAQKTMNQFAYQVIDEREKLRS